MSQFNCEMCPKVYTRHQDMINHMEKRHDFVKPQKVTGFKCEVCGKYFSYKCNLMVHMEKHHDIVIPQKVTDFKCEDCSKYFSNNWKLINHMEKHHNLVIPQKVTDFKCEVCGKYFSEKRSLINHIEKRHDFVKPQKVTDFKCEVCNKNFSSKCNLMTHMKTRHDFVKPKKVTNFKCEDCSKCFSIKGNLMRHLRTFHNLALKPKVGNLKCSMCSLNNCISHKQFRNHLLECHDVMVDKEIKYFNSDKDFADWKLEVENDTNSFYRCLVTSNNKSLCYYDCNKSSVFCRKNILERKKRVKINKCGSTCPARMVVKTFPDKTIQVCFHSRHIGHSLSLAHIKFTEKDKENMMIDTSTDKTSADSNIIEASDEGVYSDFVTETKTPSVNRSGGGSGHRSMPIELKVTRSMSRSKVTNTSAISESDQSESSSDSTSTMPMTINSSSQLKQVSLRNCHSTPIRPKSKGRKIDMKMSFSSGTSSNVANDRKSKSMTTPKTSNITNNNSNNPDNKPTTIIQKVSDKLKEDLPVSSNCIADQSEDPDDEGSEDCHTSNQIQFIQPSTSGVVLPAVGSKSPNQNIAASIKTKSPPESTSTIPMTINLSSRQKPVLLQNCHSTPLRPRSKVQGKIAMEKYSSSGDSSNFVNDDKSKSMTTLKNTNNNPNNRLSMIIQKMSDKLNESGQVSPNSIVDQNEDAEDEGSEDLNTLKQTKPSTSGVVLPTVGSQSSNQNIAVSITTKSPPPSLQQPPPLQQRQMLFQIAETDQPESNSTIPITINLSSRQNPVPWQNRHSTPIWPKSKVQKIDKEVVFSSSGDSSDEANDHKSRSKTTSKNNSNNNLTNKLTTMIQKVSDKLNEDSRVLSNCSVDQNEDADDEGSEDNNQLIPSKPFTSGDIHQVSQSPNQNKVASITTTKSPPLSSFKQQLQQQLEHQFCSEYRDRLNYFNMPYQKKLLRSLLQRIIEDSSCLMAKWILKEVMDQYGFVPNPDLAQPLIRINSDQQPSIEFFFKGSRKSSSIVKILKSVDAEFLRLSTSIYSFAYAMYGVMSSKVSH